MHLRGSLLALGWCVALSTLACAGGKPAESPAAEGDKAAEADGAGAGDEAKSENSDQAKADASKADGAKADKPADDGGPKPTRSPQDIVEALFDLSAGRRTDIPADDRTALILRA